MDIETAPRTDPDLARCPGCGRPDGTDEQVVSRHRVSFGTVAYTRCACGRLSVRTERADVFLVR
ncbi:hypothetical protein [Nocardiopsis suaedae]|uniref:Uncharacterized protein n=1 Tax=Nocardiopsis suaedae TaxID=3018444 RepID=A0ABT4TV94_9ACTN|nr:hypothetical protein [Nocardiopsis suaedae]MDA2808130.1 hypothetical protein [Nocardiopsis suaedae]